ncbi:MAG: tRNA (N(6)-L-threonylcarbamoyladenosine(37)-C(2))-methylthiotransferase MtaB [Clostridia bacterium]|nr:tRNA (N(6)-L-threonylcarbamoyladenosine(37)-C(2))-methylthiotransferase MtaB [Clostridia bacterium]
MAKTSKSAGIYTLGCKVNQYESEAIAEELQRQGVEVLPPTEVCDAYIINTCTVTAESDRKARQFIRRAVSRNPQAVIVVTGCLAQTAPESLLRIAGVDAVVGNTEKLAAAKETVRLLDTDCKSSEQVCRVSDIDACGFESMAITTFERTRAYVKIEDGCESRCTYCIIPAARGKIRSKPPDDVVAEVTALTENGCREVVLTGIETASYGKDLGHCDLAELLARIDRIPGIGRVRLGSLDPSLIRPAFVERIAGLGSLSPHFHLSLQSGSSRILALMKRKYNAEQAMNAIRLLRERMPGVQFTTDVIVGFPGETEEDFRETVNFVERAEFLMVHIFPYSKRQGTPAAQMSGQIPEEVKRRRLHELEEVVRAGHRRILENALRIRPRREVLFESYENGYAYGHTDDFLEVAVPVSKPLHGRLETVLLKKTDGVVCFGELIGAEGGAMYARRDS